MDWSRRLRSKSAKKTELFCSGHAEIFYPTLLQSTGRVVRISML